MRSQFLASLAALLFLAAPVHAAPKEDPLAKRVNAAIDSGVKYLRDQGKNGDWEVQFASKVAYPGGVSALALLALLNAGVPPDDPVIAKGLEYLRKVPAEQTYVVSLQTMVLIQAGQGVDKPRIEKNVKWLLDARTPNGWGYGKRDGLGPDHSNSQYALLALHEALRAGYTVDRPTLEEIQKFYVKTQNRDGGWSYRDVPGSRVSMTTAGLCGLYITGMDLSVGRARLRPDGSAVDCGKYDENPNVARAIAWLSGRLPSQIDEQTIRDHGLMPVFYTLYGIERAGRLSGQRYLGEHDWYRTGCEYLVNVQNADNSWKGDRLGEDSKIIATSFALLFLSKGRTPVLLTKLAYGQPDYAGWNNKRNDARNLTEFASDQLFNKRPLAWQVFDVRRKRADGEADRRDLAAELLQSPVVFFNGHDKAPSGKEEEILKEYVANGGFIFAEACCGSEAFDRDFRALMKRMFDQAELVELPNDHPVWTSKFLVTPRDPFPLYGVQHGCKWVVIYSPRPISGYWEQNDTTHGKGKVAFELGANILAYATGLEPPKYKGEEAPIFRGDPQKGNIPRGYLQVAQLKHEKFRPALTGVRNLMAESRKVGLDVTLETKVIDPTFGKVVEDYNFFYMHGKDPFKYNVADLKALRFKLESGSGTLLADACCGAPAFDKSFRQFIDELFAHKTKLEPIPLDDLLFSKKLNPVAVDKVRCRLKAGQGYANVAPALEGVKFEGRWVVIYSKYDLGCALEHANTPDCLGHDYDSAVKLGRAAVLYHLHR